MTITELIAKLESARKVLGDVPVEVRSNTALWREVQYVVECPMPKIPDLFPVVLLDV